jgi:protein-tyrosine phosphatase
VFRALVAEGGLARQIETDSAGTIAFHTDEPPDARARETALARGVDLENLRARQVIAKDFARFDLVVALDRSHLSHLVDMCPDGAQHRVCMLMDFAPEAGVKDVPDPYYGGVGGFDHVYSLIEAGAAGLLAEIRDRHLWKS